MLKLQFLERVPVKEVTSLKENRNKVNKLRVILLCAHSDLHQDNHRMLLSFMSPAAPPAVENPNSTDGAAALQFGGFPGCSQITSDTNICTIY